MAADRGRRAHAGDALSGALVAGGGADGPAAASDPEVSSALAVRGLVKHYGPSRALDGVSLEVRRGQTVGLVGESGAGKTTLARAILRLVEPDAGSIHLGATDFRALRGAALRAARRRIQPLFQDPGGSLDPRLTVEDSVAEPLAIHGVVAGGTERRARVGELMGRVGLPPDVLGRRPHELSGGERQRVALARALAAEPAILIADEPLASLDAAARLDVARLLAGLQQRDGLALLLISHDLSTVRHLAQRVLVMYAGTVVESGSAAAIFATPAHPYTRALLAAAPTLDPTRRRVRVLVEGEPPSPDALPPGCRFHPRCPLYAVRHDRRCIVETPALAAVASDDAAHAAACIYARPGA